MHLDGSRHAWFTLAPEVRPTWLTVPDDATNRVLYAQFWEAESTRAVLSALRAVVPEYGLPMAIYSDRAHWAFHTPTAGRPVDKTRLTQVGRELARLGLEQIPAWVPVGDLDLDQVLCHEAPRVVGQDNTVTLDCVVLQVAPQPGRRTCAGLEVFRAPQSRRAAFGVARDAGRPPRPRTRRLDQPHPGGST